MNGDKKTRFSIRRTLADLESAIANALYAADANTAFTSPVRIHFTCYRKKLADIDNLSGKAVIDGLVAAGILADDSAKQVTEVTYHQVKATVERTVVTIEEVI